MIYKLRGCLYLFFLFLLLSLSIPVNVQAITIKITFDEYSFNEGDPLTDQYAALGVIFSGTNTSPIIAQEENGEAYGYFYGSYPDRTDDVVLSDYVSGGNMLTDGLGNHSTYPFLIGDDIKATFTIPVTQVSFYLLDIDAKETYTARVYNNVTGLIAEQSFSSGDPGTGDGIATLFSFSTTVDNPIDYLIIDVPDWSGYAIDDFSFTSPIPEPATIFLLGVGLLGVAGLVRKKRFFLGLDNT